MTYKDPHISDQELMLAADGELSKWRSSAVRIHLTRCWTCRARMKEIEDTIVQFVRAYRGSLYPKPPAPSVPRARLRARLNQLAAQHPRNTWRYTTQSVFARSHFTYLAGSFVFLLVILMLWQSREPSLAFSPNPRLTPGATRSVTAADICAREPAERSHLALATVGKMVFEEYGIHDPQPRRYELDYLIDPDLGGSDDVRNLWPEPYSATWNANVKDALEDHLRELVCTGKISLVQAQHDISLDWISAYKKYFHTESPLPEHLVFKKDQPWQ